MKKKIKFLSYYTYKKVSFLTPMYPYTHLNYICFGISLFGSVHLASKVCTYITIASKCTKCCTKYFFSQLSQFRPVPVQLLHSNLIQKVLTNSKQLFEPSRVHINLFGTHWVLSLGLWPVWSPRACIFSFLLGCCSGIHHCFP